MKAGLRMVPLFLRRDGARNELRSAGLTAAGVAVATAVALTVLSFLPGLEGRANRMAWREPQAAPAATATAVQQRSTDIFDNHVIDRVDFAPLSDKTAGLPTPLSLKRFDPAPLSDELTAPPTPPGLDRVDVAPLSDETVGLPAPLGFGRVDPAPLASEAAGLPTPPGLDRFPAAGEIYVSPALQRLLEDTPADELGDRYPGKVVGTIGSAGLANENELVVVVGRGADDLVPDWQAKTGDRDERFPSDPSAVLPIAGFATSGHDEILTAYGQAVAVVAILIAVPAVLLVGSAARLTAARRNQRLAALRLTGATPGGIVTLTAVETALAAFIGAVVGVGLYAAFLPVAAQFPLAGGPWASGDLWLGVGPALVTLVAVPLVAAASATVALRQVSISPLGVAQRVSGRRPRAVRLLAMAGAWVLLAVAATSMQGDDGIGLLLVAIGVVIGSLAVVGPWIAWILGKMLVGLSRRPPTLLAGRRIVDDPKAAYRSVSGIVLAGFLAGLVFAVGPSADAADPGDRDSEAMQIWVPGEIDPTVAPAAAVRLATADLSATVDATDLGDGWALLVEPEDPADMERVRTALTGLVPAHLLVGDDDDVQANDNRFEDFRRVSVALLVIALVLAGTATAIGSAASVLDQRVTLHRLRLAGTPVGVLQRARVWHAALPLVAATTASVVSGMFTAYMLMLAGGAHGDQIQPPDIPALAAVLVLGLGIGIASATITRPLLLITTTTEPP